MRDGSGLEAVAEMGAGTSGPRVVVVSVEDAPGFAERALAAGATGFVVKDHADEELADAVNAAARGARYVSPVVQRRLPTGGRERPARELSPRETQVLRLIALGHTNVEIAAKLGLSPRTVETHRGNVQHKLGVRTRAELVRYALEQGLLAS
jgi:two-component system response regulator NreC